ncbi:hypothetical protein BDY19DRAFT_992280 [Irpex rosettiformis]|uniref:Uncharacterized protein n=1 Tax=Irpex rosettiformis TaxID=378272 RepID=A0ACB8U9U3_9APHY|nr:hypothetical protein BDY19DRAFT_992280 [Irpex rosettiformis]
MVLQAAYSLVSNAIPSGYFWHIAGSLAVVVVTHAFAQGRTTDRERDLHARTILVTGSFTPLGLTIISNLASRGAHIIALSPYSLEHPLATLLIPALREETKNEHIFVEQADLTSPKSIREFCTKFLTGDDQRLDGIVFAHEYACIGSFFDSKKKQEENRQAASLATFLMTTLLLPALLVAPVERDIRIVHIVNPFYAAAMPTFTSDLISSMSSDPGSQEKSRRPLLLSEGHRALRTIVLSRHLQRILNALPNRAPMLDPEVPGSRPSGDESESLPPQKKAGEPKLPSNIVAVSVCPGVSRSENVRSLLGLDNDSRSMLIFLLYLLLYPLIWLYAKSPNMATQTVLHALFLPTPFKRALAHLAAATDSSSTDKTDKTESSGVTRASGGFTEVVKPGALYRECSAVILKLAPLPDTIPPRDAQDGNDAQSAKDNNTRKGKEKATKSDGQKKTLDEVDLEIEDDGEYGGEGVGRVVWEWYETRLKAWDSETEAREGKEHVENRS